MDRAESPQEPGTRLRGADPGSAPHPDGADDDRRVDALMNKVLIHTMERRISDFPVPAHRWPRSVAALLVGLALPCAAPATADPAPPAPAEQRFTLRVGYQPYFAEAWSGAVLRAQHLHADRLPRDVGVEFKVGMTGAGALMSALRQGDVDLAYLGLAPTLVVSQDTGRGDFRIIAVSSVSRRLCNVVLAQAGADVSSRQAALHWLDGRTVSVPRGSCADLFLADVLEQGNVQPARVLDQGFDVLATSFREHRVDAVAVWEPIASDLIRTANAVRLVDGDSVGETSAAFLVATAALLRDHPDVVRGWLDAERAAQQVLARSTERSLPIDALAGQAVDFPKESLSAAWSGPRHSGAWTSPASFPFIVTPDVTAILTHAAKRMAHRRLLASPTLRPGSVDDSSARAILAAAHDSGATPRGGP